MEKDGFSWWIRRIRRAQDLYDEFRIDHFRGFAGFWAVPSGERTRLCLADICLLFMCMLR